MANVNVTQIRTILQSVHPSSVCLIHASVLLSILNSYKTSAGSEVTVTAATPGSSPPGTVDLSKY